MGQFILIYENNYCSQFLFCLLISHKQIKEGITIIVVRKKTAQSPLTNLQELLKMKRGVVLPAVPKEASKAY